MKHFTQRNVADDDRKMISDRHTLPLKKYNPSHDVEEDHGTMHLSVMDKDGNAVAMTSTINLLFGAKVIDPVTGIFLNNEMVCAPALSLILIRFTTGRLFYPWIKELLWL